MDRQHRQGPHIIITGFMGAGKSTVSEMLAQRLHMPLMDTDLQIETEQGRPVRQIFDERGEAWFRLLESGLLERLAKSSEKMVVSTGGGLPIQPQNRELLAKAGIVIYLQVSAREVLRRLDGDTSRPLLASGDKQARVQDLLAKREPVYQSTADMIIETDGMSPEQIVERIIEQLRKSEQSEGEDEISGN